MGERTERDDDKIRVPDLRIMNNSLGGKAFMEKIKPD